MSASLSMRNSHRRLLRLQKGFSFVPPSSIVPVASRPLFRSTIAPVPPSFNKISVPQFRMAFSMISSDAQLQCAEGEDATQLESEVNSLLERGWKVDEERMGVTKTFHFKTYFKAVSFLNLIAAESAAKKHHPTMTVRIGSVDVHWTTHKPRGLSSKDTSMARHCDEGAELMGAVEEGQGKKCVPPSS